MSKSDIYSKMSIRELESESNILLRQQKLILQALMIREHTPLREIYNSFSKERLKVHTELESKLKVESGN